MTAFVYYPTRIGGDALSRWYVVLSSSYILKSLLDMSVADFYTRPTLDHFRFLPMAQIAYLQSDRNYTFIYFQDGTRCLFSKTLGVLEAELSTDCFLRINRNTTINTALISHYDRKTQTMVLRNGLSFEVARRRRARMKKWRI